MFPSTLSPEQLDAEVLRLAREKLAGTEEFAERERTLPFLYSAVVQGLLNAGYSVHGLTMERLRYVLTSALDEEGGRWSLPPEPSAAA